MPAGTVPPEMDIAYLLIIVGLLALSLALIAGCAALEKRR
jgi:hypothetical protein